MNVCRIKLGKNKKVRVERMKEGKDGDRRGLEGFEGHKERERSRYESRVLEVCSTSDIRGITDFDGSKEGEGTGDRSKILGMGSIGKLMKRDLREGDAIRELEMQEGSKTVEDQGEVVVMLIKEGGEDLIDSKEIMRDRGD